MTAHERLDLARARTNSLAVHEALVAEGRIDCTPKLHDAMASLACAASIDLDLALAS
jgi:hypothetical protein